MTFHTAINYWHTVINLHFTLQSNVRTHPLCNRIQKEQSLWINKVWSLLGNKWWCSAMADTVTFVVLSKLCNFKEAPQAEGNCWNVEEENHKHLYSHGNRLHKNLNNGVIFLILHTAVCPLYYQRQCWFVQKSSKNIYFEIQTSFVIKTTRFDVDVNADDEITEQSAK